MITLGRGCGSVVHAAKSSGIRKKYFRIAGSVSRQDTIRINVKGRISGSAGPVNSRGYAFDRRSLFYSGCRKALDSRTSSIGSTASVSVCRPINRSKTNLKVFCWQQLHPQSASTSFLVVPEQALIFFREPIRRPGRGSSRHHQGLCCSDCE